MKRPGLIVALVAIGLAIALYSIAEHRRHRRMDAQVNAALGRYSNEFKIGTTRGEIERRLSADGRQWTRRTWSTERGAPWETVVEVGSDDSPWYFGGSTIYVTFEFDARGPSITDGAHLSFADTLKRVHLETEANDAL